jgi:homocysteine S-methyltransferase
MALLTELPDRHPFAPFVAIRGCAVLDGGLATHLETLGFDLSGTLWSARALREAPDLVRRAHLDYLDAGAECVATASYQATIPGLVRCGATEREARRLLRRSVELAREAVDEFQSARAGAAAARPRARPLVAASVGPFGAYLADGSEYRGRYALRRRELLSFHRPRWRELLAAGPDLLAAETIPSADEALALLDLLDQTPPEGARASAWISLQCRDRDHLADGTPLEEVVPRLSHPALVGIGVNCMPPALAAPLLESLRALTGVPLLVYPNSGERWEGGRWAGAAADWIVEAPRWRDLGAVAVGGCCRIGPSHIRALRKVLERVREAGA